MRRLVTAILCLCLASPWLACRIPAASASPSSGWRVTVASRSAGTANAIACRVGRACVVVGQLRPSAHSGAARPYRRAVACSASGCISVGEVMVTLGAWRDSARRWVRMRFHPAVSGDYEGWLSSATCVSSRDCMAVGEVDARTRVDCAPNAMGLTWCETLVPVLERWNGVTWTRQGGFPVPVVARVAVPLGSEQGFSALDAISCGSGAWCVAVGHVGSTSVGGSGLVIGPDFADTWNGSRWRLRILPAPRGSTPELASISCTAGRRCVAVGSVSVDGVTKPYAVQERGGSWSDVAPRIAGAALLDSVSCVPDGSCMAVGYRGAGAGRRPLVERWRGGHWTAEAVQVPRNSRQRGGAELSGVSCTAAPAGPHTPAGIGSCAAVGGYGHTTRAGLDVAWFVESPGPGPGPSVQVGP